MNLSKFLLALDDLTLDDIRALASELDAMVANAAEEVEVTRSYLRIESILRHEHKVREAAHASHRAAEAIVAVATRCGADLPDSTVTRVARAAATIARGLVVETQAAPEVAFLLQGFAHTRPVSVLV